MFCLLRDSSILTDGAESPSETRSAFNGRDQIDLINDDDDAMQSIGTLPLIAFEDKNIRVGPIPGAMITSYIFSFRNRPLSL